MSPRIEWFGEFENCAMIILDRPEKRNAVDMATLIGLKQLLKEVQVRQVRVVVLAGAGPAFCSGADLDGVELGEFTETLSSVLQDISDLPCLTVALIDGPALGAGMQLAAACDLRAATAGSSIGIPAVKLGLAVDLWTIERIGREAGWNVARRILLTGEALLAEDLAGQFVHRIMSKDRSLDECRQWCEQLSSLAPLSVRAHKLAIALASAGPGTERDEGLIENARLAAWASSDAAEGRRAFLEKRAPRFTGH